MLNIISEFGRLYPEIMDELRKVESYVARWVYLCLICYFPIDEWWNLDDVWVAGRIDPTIDEIAEVAEVDADSIPKILDTLKKHRLIAQEEGRFLRILRYMKKDDAHMSAKEISERLARMRQEIKALKGNRI